MNTTKWMLIAVVILAVILGLMNLHSYTRKKNFQTRKNSDPTTKPPIVMDPGGEEADPMPVSAENELITEDFATGDTSEWEHTGVAMPEGFY